MSNPFKEFDREFNSAPFSKGEHFILGTVVHLSLGCGGNSDVHRDTYGEYGGYRANYLHSYPLLSKSKVYLRNILISTHDLCMT